MNGVFSKFRPIFSARGISRTTIRSRTFEPDYLDTIGPEPDKYPPMNLRLRGYDFHVLEHFHRFVKKWSERMGLNVSECWATPARSLHVETFVEGGTEVKETYGLKIYERNVQVVDLKSTEAPVLLEMIKTATPSGVSVVFQEHTSEYLEARYIPDPFIESIRSDLNELESKKETEVEKAAGKKATKTAIKTTPPVI